MLHYMNRRKFLGLGMGGAAVATLGGLPSLARAADVQGRVLKINTLAASAAVNVPLQAGLRSVLPTLAGYAAPEVQPTAKIPQIVQQVIAGASDLGDGDVASSLAACEAGADLRIIGLSYNNTSQVVVANADKLDSLASLASKGGTVAVSGIGDFMHVMLQGVLDKHGLPKDKINFVEMGSSGDRARALMSGRVDAVPMHVEQFEQLKSRGHFDTIVRPWEEYEDWFSAVIVARADWLQKDENRQAAVAVLKSALTAFRHTTADYAWYKSQVAEYASSKDLRGADDDLLKPVWETLCQRIHAFPGSMEQMTPDAFAKVIPVYKKTGALQGTIDLAKVIDRSYLEQAIKELG
ncbi:hypothetical protein CAL29_25340 [Bordetella genomosp. 10]|uniref:SsuA/THI5-like domain-containing protein n=1 Tax=Bordetella genomosp. 10 TaxID=1416804 RepID=A0A261S2U1_9BORD|nr:ABC transporter substrate-binding protein [Bordetella genomosp. 10]OZI31252.1 hypothetical protein CAL29_25340 [Bordetella genomosp. 10]